MTRRTRTAVRFLLLGIFLNVICCWFLVGYVSFTPSLAHFVKGELRSEPWAVMTWQPRGGMMISAAVNRPVDSIPAIDNADAHLPSWSRLDRLPAYEAGALMPKFHDVAYGWPMLGLAMSYDTYHHPAYGVMVSDHVAGVIPGVEFPIRVIPVGFAVNTCFFAIAGWLLALALLAIRTRIRLRHGYCPACAHDLLGAVGAGCPKCGWSDSPATPAELPDH